MINVAKLKAGDKIRRVGINTSGYAFTTGKEYTLCKDSDGELYVCTDEGSKYDEGHIQANLQRWENVEPPADFVGDIEIEEVEWCGFGGGGSSNEVTLTVDKLGLESVQRLVAQSRDELEKRKLENRIATVELELAELKKKRETIK